MERLDLQSRQHLVRSLVALSRSEAEPLFFCVWRKAQGWACQRVTREGLLWTAIAEYQERLLRSCCCLWIARALETARRLGASLLTSNALDGSR
jgi:hypothetical protein